MNRELIRTKIKFTRSEKDGITLVGYVSENENNFYYGCREDSPVKKKVVIPDSVIAEGMVENTLYDCTLKPMRNGKGFIAVKAEICLFPATVEFSIANNRYKASVRFGNKTIVYDPQYGRDDSVKTVEGALGILERRNDIRDKQKVVDSFLQAANIVSTLYKEYRRHRL